MRKILFDAEGRLRNGWWVLVFLAFMAVTVVAYRPISKTLQGWGVHEGWLEFMPAAMVLLATWGCTRLRREKLAGIGLVLDARWARQALAGFALGCGSLALAAALVWAIGGVRFELDPARGVSALLHGLYFFLGVALFEELLFRGFAFQRLVAGLGSWPGLVAGGLLFAVVHWGNPGMDGVTMWVATIDIALAGVMLGLAWMRTRSLALPIGLHLGWNWMQGNVFGFGVSGTDQVGWLQPSFTGLPQWLTGGEFGPEASVFGIVADLVMLAVVWKWAPVPAAVTAKLPAVATPEWADPARIP